MERVSVILLQSMSTIVSISVGSTVQWQCVRLCMPRGHLDSLKICGVNTLCLSIVFSLVLLSSFHTYSSPPLCYANGYASCLLSNRQRTGNIAWRATEDARRLMVLTKYGVKVTDMKCQEVFLRLPMHKICSAIRFIEDTGEHCVALEADDGNQGLFSYYVFQIPDDASDPRQGNAATVFCSTLDQAFEVMHSKTVLEAST